MGREIYVPRRTEENERREIKKIDLQLKRKERHSHIGSGYFRDFGDEISQRTAQDKTNRNETLREKETNRDAESNTSNNSKEAVATHEPGVCRAIPVKEYRDGPIEERAVHYVRKKPRRRREGKTKQTARASAEVDFLLDLETVTNETAADPYIIELNCCIGGNNTSQIPDDYKTVAKKLTHRWSIIMVDDRIIIPKTLRYATLNALHLGHPGINKMCCNATIF